MTRVFGENYAGFKAQGFKIGFYHFMTARSQAEAREQARFFAETIEGTQPDCRLAVDFERASGLSDREANDIVLAFLEETERLTGKEMVIYSDAWAARSLWDERLTRYPLWVANYGVDSPEPNGKWDVWAGLAVFGSRADCRYFRKRRPGPLYAPDVLERTGADRDAVPHDDARPDRDASADAHAGAFLYVHLRPDAHGFLHRAPQAIRCPASLRATTRASGRLRI